MGRTWKGKVCGERAKNEEKMKRKMVKREGKRKKMRLRRKAKGKKRKK